MSETENLRKGIRLMDEFLTIREDKIKRLKNLINELFDDANKGEEEAEEKEPIDSERGIKTN